MKQEPHNRPLKIPVVLLLYDLLSGVNSWAFELRKVFADHPRYQVLLLNLLSESKKADINVDIQNFEIAMKTVSQILRERAPVIVVLNYAWYLCEFIPPQDGIYYIGTCHADSEDEYYKPLTRYESHISKFIAVSPECAETLSQRIPHRAQDITMLPYGIVVPETLERQYQANPIRLMYGGRVEQTQKRVMDFVPLVENLLRQRVNFVFDIVGDGKELPALQEVMQKLSTKCIRFHGLVPLEKMTEFWRSHDIFIQVSEFEGTSVSMLEAMAQGTVPVITDVRSGIKNVITHAHNGFCVPIGDMGAMANIIADLAAHPNMLATVGHAAYDNAQQFSMKTYMEKFSTFLDHVIASQELQYTEIQKALNNAVIAQHPLRKIISAIWHKLRP